MQDIKDFEPLWGEWRSVEMLGQGTFGRVYKMVKRDLDKEYYSAVKHLSLPSEPDEEKALYSEGLVTDQETLKTYYDGVLKDLRSEIDLCYKLKGNTNIVSYEEHYIRPKASGFGYDIFIKMELLTGLQDRIKEGGLTVRDVVKLGEDICQALTVLRREKIIHRDIKPGNIFVNSRGDYKLGDFGISRSMERTVNSMSVKGTFSYMAPEVAKGNGGDYQVDLYSLGVVLYRMLNKNRAPFLPPPPQTVTHEMNMLAQERRLRGEVLPPPAEADEELAGIILKACAYRPEDRWESAEEMGRALAKYRLNMKEPETLAPEGLPEGEEITEFLPGGPIQPEEDTVPDGPVEPPKQEAAAGSHAETEANKRKTAFLGIAAAAGVVILIGAVGIFPLGNRFPSPPDGPEVPPPTVSVPVQPEDDESEPILWRDPFIRDSVLNILGVDEAAITLEILAGLKELSVPVPESGPDSEDEPEPPATVTTLADLAMLTGLKTLDLSGHMVEDFDFPEAMPSLETLKLAGCGCTSLEFLNQVSLESLRTLDLSGNEIANLAPLAGLTRLTELNISGTQAGSLEPLGGLSELTVLSAEGIPAEDWSFVDGITQVEGRPEEPEQTEEVQPQKPAESQKPSTPTKPNNSSKPSGNHTSSTGEPNTPSTPSTPSEPAAPTTVEVSSVSVSSSNEILEVGRTVQLSASVSPANATNQEVSWESLTPSVATVNESGLVRAVDRGTARITASCDGKSGTCTITVVD